MSKILVSENTYNSYCDAKMKVRRNKMLVRIVIVAVIWAIIGGVLISPLLKTNIKSLSGNPLNFNEDYIYEIGGFNKSSFIWHNDYKEIEEKLKSHRFCRDAEIKVGFLGLNITIDEVILVGKSYDEDPYFYLSDGSSYLYSKIKDRLLDPLAPEGKFLGKYSEDCPNISKLNYELDEFARLTKELGDLDHDLLMKVDSINKDPNYNKFAATTLKFNEETTGLDKEFSLTVDTRQLSKLITQELVDNVIKEVQKGKNCYNYFVDIKDEEIVVYPLDKN